MPVMPRYRQARQSTRKTPFEPACSGPGLIADLQGTRRRWSLFARCPASGYRAVAMGATLERGDCLLVLE